jgi:Arc/MetJ family transcription regulator
LRLLEGVPAEVGSKPAALKPKAAALGSSQKRRRTGERRDDCTWRTPIREEMVYAEGMARTNIVIDEELVRKARKLTRLKTKRQIVDRALELLVRSESRKGILRHYGTGIWKGNLKAMRRNRV